jgi:hypothetical protein
MLREVSIAEGCEDQSRELRISCGWHFPVLEPMSISKYAMHYEVLRLCGAFEGTEITAWLPHT